MPTQEVLIMAVTQMLSGVCTAGFVHDPHAPGKVRWLRPVKEHDTLLLGDVTDAEGRVIRCADVVALEMLKPRPAVPHVEDWIADLLHHRPRVVRRLEGERRDAFLSRHLDPAPAEVIEQHRRSLCLIRPDDVWAYFRHDPYTNKYEARIGFSLAGTQHPKANAPGGIPVTDVAWRAQGRRWLAGANGALQLDRSDLLGRLGATEMYLVLGLSRIYQGDYWLMVIGVHPVPEYAVDINYKEL
jgi:hypothetical protein